MARPLSPSVRSVRAVSPQRVGSLDASILTQIKQPLILKALMCLRGAVNGSDA